MPESVIVDDGGSTEIRWIKDGVHGNLDGLIKVGDMGHGRKGSNHKIKAAFTQVVVVYQDQQGNPHSITHAVSKYVVIASSLDQNVRLENLASRSFQFTVYSDVTEPAVECTLSLNKRVYTVTNAGTIKMVTVDDNVIYSLTKIRDSLVPAKKDKPLLLTSVAVS